MYHQPPQRSDSPDFEDDIDDVDEGSTITRHQVNNGPVHQSPMKKAHKQEEEPFSKYKKSPNRTRGDNYNPRERSRSRGQQIIEQSINQSFSALSKPESTVGTRMRRVGSNSANRNQSRNRNEEEPNYEGSGRVKEMMKRDDIGHSLPVSSI